MAEAFKFTCERCGDVHEGLPDFGFDAPIYYHETPEAERAERCWLTDDLCVLDDTHYFVRAVLLVRLAQTLESFGWGVWTSLSQQNYQRYVALWDAPIPEGEGPYFGWLSNRIPFYPDTLNLKVAVHLHDSGERPHLELEPTDHPLAIDQRQGIAWERARDIVEALVHGPSTPSP
jgi:hypothetical protein